jgi:SSS family solute:Na+ symporter
LFALLEDYAPAGLAILVLSAIVAASCSTANGVILGTAAVVVRNVAGMPQREVAEGARDPLLRTVRATMLPVVGAAIFFAIRVPQTGILLTLAFDLMLAGLVVPFVFAHYARRVTSSAAVAAIAVGVTVRLVLFALTPTFYGAENTLLYVSNPVFGPGFDGWPTFVAPVTSLLAFLGALALTRPRAPSAVVRHPAPETDPA